jgi:histidinol-phosphate aminotransferase
VVCVRSLGKTLGVSGLRVGYLIAEAGLAAHFESCRASFTTSVLAQVAAQWAMTEDCEAFVARSRQRLLEDRDRLAYVLDKLELTTTPSAAAFSLVRMTRAAEVASDLLAQHAICVRECSAFGIPDHLRVAGLPADAERRFERALREVMEQRKLLRGRD